MLIQSRRLLEAVRAEGAPGGSGAPAAPAAAIAAAPAAAPAEWLKPLGEHGKAFESFKDAAELATKWTELNTEITTLKAKQPEDWRKAASTVDGKVDENIAKTIARYNDLPSVAKALVEAQTKIRAGEIAKPLTKDSTPEQVTEYRKAHGIPEKPEGYFEKLPDGLVIGEVDKPVFDALGKIAHDHHIAPAAMHAFTKWYYDGQTAVQAEEQKLDHADKLKATGELRTLWGNDYTPNMNILSSHLDGLGPELKGLLMDATLGDGQRLMNNSKAVEFLVKQAREINPLAHVLPAGGEGNIKSLETEIAGIEKVMREDRKRYDGDEKMRARLRELYTAREKLQAR